jgi:cytoskeletal protein CcmA (bactofilin family)
MFRRKDNEAGNSTTGSPSRGSADVKPMPQPDQPRRSNEVPAASAGAAETGGKRLMIDQGISLSGEITACDRLIVEGIVQVMLNGTKAIEIAESGRFTNGKAEVEDAEISGTYEGELTVRNRLLIRATGKVEGTVRYGELEIERGGRLTGSVSMIEKR